mgnify:CR=1 FL=1
MVVFLVVLNQTLHKFQISKNYNLILQNKIFYHNFFYLILYQIYSLYFHYLHRLKNFFPNLLTVLIYCIFFITIYYKKNKIKKYFSYDCSWSDYQHININLRQSIIKNLLNHFLSSEEGWTWTLYLIKKWRRLDPKNPVAPVNKIGCLILLIKFGIFYKNV